MKTDMLTKGLPIKRLEDYYYYYYHFFQFGTGGNAQEGQACSKCAHRTGLNSVFSMDWKELLNAFTEAVLECLISASILLLFNYVLYIAT